MQKFFENSFYSLTIFKKTSSNEVIDPKKTTIKISKDVPMADKKIKEIRDDVFDALDRLEQIDVDES